MQTPKVSVVTAVYNGEKYLSCCIDSILAQTMQGFEFIIVNDGSTDSTAKIIREYADKDKRIRAVDNEHNIGISASRNMGVDAANTDYIVVMDADDEAYTDRLEAQYAFLVENTAFDGVGADIVYIDDAGKQIDMKRSEIKEQVSKDDLISDPMALIHVTVMVKKECLIGVGGYREEFKRAVDYDLLLRMTEKYAFCNLKKPVTKLRISFASGTINERNAQLKYCEIANQLASQRKECGTDILQNGDVEAFAHLKKEVFGLDLMPFWMKKSSNYLYWANRMYHRGPLDYARKLAAASVKHNPFNIKAWFYLIFLCLSDSARSKLTDIKKVFSN